MSRGDFNQYENADTNHELDNAVKNEGSTALHVLDGGVTSMDILAQSETDAPTEGRFEGWARGVGGGGMGFVFRFQDPDNFYSVHWYEWRDNDGFDRASIGLYKVVGGGSPVLVDQDEANPTGSNSNWGGQCNLSDGQGLNNFTLVRIDFWVDSGGDLRVRPLEDQDEDGTFVRFACGSDVADLVDTAPDLGGGGGMGLGGLGNSRAKGEAWYDADASGDFEFLY